MAYDYRFIMTKTPLRITFTGGGTDIPAYYKKYGKGAVVSSAINKYIYVNLKKNFFSDEIRISYSRVENSVKSIDEIIHPTIRESLRLLDIKPGIEIVSIADVPSRGTGLGSSSSFLVGLLNALHAWRGEPVGPEQLAEEAVKIEREILKEPGGKQDQYISAYGGIQLMEFFDNEEVSIKPVHLTTEEKLALNNHLLLLFTGRERDSTAIHKEQEKNLNDKIENYNKMRDLAYKTYDLLNNGKWMKLGEMLNENWGLKRELSDNITDKKIDDWYQKALRAGAAGGKLIGAGGGGFLLFFAKPIYHKRIKRVLNELKEEKFRFETFGSRIIYMEKSL
ncbi:MAG: kinase [Thermoplasmata archaeon]|jgi:D-glycero-alpha-D-manno-heptose-7-phosphate kinase